MTNDIEARSEINVYLDDGRVFVYPVKDAAKAREHAYAIVVGGYRHASEDGTEFEHYGPHRILKVKVTGVIVPTLYRDTVRGT